MNKRRGASIIVAALALGGGWWWWNRSEPIDPGDMVQVRRGQALYRQHCAQCHGPQLQGEPDWRLRKPNGELPAPPHDASGHTWHHDDAYLFAVTKHGMARFAPPDYKSAMPSYVGTLSDSDIRAVLAFIKSTWPEEIRLRQRALTERAGR